MGNADSLIQVRDVSLAYPGAAAGTNAIERVSFDVAKGELVCLVGPSGCGKSTMLSILGGFLRQTGGSVLVEGSEVHGPDPGRIFVFQDNGVFPWLTVEANVGFGLLGRPAAERAAQVKHYVEMVGLAGYEKAYPSALSGGMRQRVEIARALAAEARVLYMDEPFGALDFLTRMTMRRDLVRIWQAEHKTILFVTHDIEEAVQLADRVLVMSRRPGTILEEIRVDLPRPRDLDALGYLAVRDRILAVMGLDAHGSVIRPQTGLADLSSV